jgi:hypothetical protein
VAVPPSRNPFENGPFVRVASFCERILEERDGVWSIVRMIDRFTRRAIGPGTPEEMEPFLVELTLALHLDPGEARGGHEVRLLAEAPSGLSRELVATSVSFEGEERGVRLNIPGQMTVGSPGLYWFHVLFDGQPLTKVPLRILYERVVTGG